MVHQLSKVDKYFNISTYSLPDLEFIGKRIIPLPFILDDINLQESINNTGSKLDKFMFVK